MIQSSDKYKDYMSFENPANAAERNIDSASRKQEIETVAIQMRPYYESTVRSLDQMAIDPRNFKDLYGEDSVRSDERYVAEMQKRFFDERNARISEGGVSPFEIQQLAQVLEHQVIVGINKHKWIPYCEAVKTSSYDDIKHGIDAVVEFKQGDLTNHMGLGVDVSFSNQLDKKFDRIKKEIDDYDGVKNRLGVVKYFQSENTGIRGELSGLPRVVAALDAGVIRDLAHNRKNASNHISRHLIISEMTEQLKVFARYAEVHNPACAAKINRAYRFMQVINEGLHCDQTIEDSEYIKNRGIQEEIADNLKRFRI